MTDQRVFPAVCHLQAPDSPSEGLCGYSPTRQNERRNRVYDPFWFFYQVDKGNSKYWDICPTCLDHPDTPLYKLQALDHPLYDQIYREAKILKNR